MSDPSVVDLSEALRRDVDLLGDWDDEPAETPNVSAPVASSVAVTTEKPIEKQPEVKSQPAVIKTVGTKSASDSSTEWAEIIDVTIPVDDFEAQVPNPAHKYPFELDTFQKQAIIHLEQDHHVFIAAHTSAGKTVVAEYAIALSRKNNTRTIYTSPVKALSNQKYRDFHNTFGDIGLITGDIQLNQTASCLVMTTEILRCMLYAGSDVINDLQYVIFDEVHYINDAERGHVWEEVLILLPPHVIIVMLSATVPNTLEFAGWVGRTKKKKVFVFSTPKRPVPLEHFLYLGFNQNVNTRTHLILDSNSNFLGEGIKSANETKMKKNETPQAGRGGPGGRGGPQGRGQQQRGGRGGRGGAPAPQIGRQQARPPKPLSLAQEQTVWVSLLRDLKKREKLPAVAFTLSRKRCDINADSMSTVDMLTESEKSHVHTFFGKCIKKLTDSDQQLPQVQRMKYLLERGVAVHHSGILPILKEIVEMLFQEGFVKFLFATETFAMGVNMPARTVVFDSITKFDGTDSRLLRPAEYIQMAGRAGRRGLDPTGTVLILCMNEIPSELELKGMMLGIPTHLQSQFRLTYAMILTLLRADSISVEGMMKNSFRELRHQLNAEKLKGSLQNLEDQLIKMKEPQGALVSQLTQFFQSANLWLHEWGKVAVDLMKQMGPSKEIQIGSVVLVTRPGNVNKLGVVLKVEQSRKFGVIYRILILCDEETDAPKSTAPDKWYQMLGLAQGTKYSNAIGNSHTILNVYPADLWYIVDDVCLKIEPEKVIGDWEKRQNPRFKSDPVWAACAYAVEELTRLVQTPDLTLRPLLISSSGQVNIAEISKRRCADNVLSLRVEVDSLLQLTNIANFETEFAKIFFYQELVSQKDNVRHLMSDASLTLFPEYESKIQVLRQREYINNSNTVQLKGKVACEMGSHELLMTEMILGGVFNKLDAAEIASLLSSLVFQQKSSKDDRGTDPKEQAPTDPLKDAVEETLKIAVDLEQNQFNCQVPQDSMDMYTDLLNFELMEVVHKWALGEPFAEIIKLTTHQEGIITRCIQQLCETLRDAQDAARMIGDTQLHEKMTEASNSIKRDIVFAASLYTQ